MIRSDNLTGAILMMASMAAFTLNDTMMKSLAGEIPLFQLLFLLFLCGVLTTIVVGVIAARMGVLWPKIPQPGRGGFAWLGLRLICLFLLAATGGCQPRSGLLTWGASHPIRATSGQKG
ncbi:putative membrane protein [hydrothermal vent metagenome]|uniref:Putative membrane protein n=1 Tax=hydrothermal vent metagenome TaxID=652676 RepID=A0A3B0SDM9_9ZZZZ